MKILLAGGAGFIGTHTAVALIEAGHSVVVADNYCNSCSAAVHRVEKITGKDLPVFKIDVCDRDAVARIFKAHKIDCVIHFAGLKAVGESVKKPLIYYRNNIALDKDSLFPSSDKYLQKKEFTILLNFYS